MKGQTKLIPFNVETDYDADLIILGIFQGTKVKNKVPHYETRIGYNPGTEEFIPAKSLCLCWAFSTGRAKDPNYLCKHQKILIRVATNFKEELSTWAT